MKITIDTKEDSQEDIRRVIEILRNSVGEKAETNQPSTLEISEPESGNVLASIFGSEGQENAPSTPSIIEDTYSEKPKEDDDAKKQFQIEEYY
ncbi:hypothetical protein HY638_00915 [Candidatus Woesearchaeota archaeon]|nr:hypothetical protein [Candidatus Woesearchaeota archaeon]